MIQTNPQIAVIKSELEKRGWLLLNMQSEEDLNQIIEYLGEVIYETDVTVNSESKGMVTSSRGLDFHTDHHKAKYIVWHCIYQTDQGGESILIDAENIYMKLPSEDQIALKQIQLYEHKVFEDDAESHPLVYVDENGIISFYYSFWLLRKADEKNSALLAFQSLLRKSNQFRFKMQPKDILIVNNHKILHGRTPITGTKTRFLKRFWIK